MKVGCLRFLGQLSGDSFDTSHTTHHPRARARAPFGTTTLTEFKCSQFRLSILALSGVGHALWDLGNQSVQSLGQTDLATQTRSREDEDRDGSTFNTSETTQDAAFRQVLKKRHSL